MHSQGYIAYLVERLDALVLLEVDQVLAVLVDGADGGGDGLVLVEHAVSGGERASLAQGDGRAACGGLGRSRRCRDGEREGNSKEERGLGEHRSAKEGG